MPNPLRYQGNLSYYHVGSLKKRVWRGQVSGVKIPWWGIKCVRVTFILLIAAVILTALAGVVWIGISG